MIIHCMFIWQTLMQNKVTTLNYLKMKKTDCFIGYDVA